MIRFATSSQGSKLLPTDAHVWLTLPEDNREPQLLKGCRRMLDVGEMERFSAFAFPADQHLYLVAHALLRTTLSRYAGYRPHQWRFYPAGRGRPEIVEGQQGESPLRFSLSHTGGLAAVAVAHEVNIGLDVERVNRQVDMLSIASRYFSRVEAMQLEKLSASERRQRFFEYWTLKEAYVKARGEGLSIPLDEFYFYQDRGGLWKIAFPSESEAGDNPEQWQFESTRLDSGHHLALAIQRRWRREFTASVFEVSPLEVSVSDQASAGDVET